MTKSKNPEYLRRYAKYHRNGYRAQVPALGSMRRIQALCSIGYTIRELAKHTGLSEVYLYNLANGLRATRIDKKRAQKIDEVYRTLSVQPCHYKSHHTSRTVSLSRKKGWAPPMAWNDIDNPKEKPKGVLFHTTCYVRVGQTKQHPHGHPCGEGGQLRKGMCRKHYVQAMKEAQRGRTEEQFQEAA